MVRRSRVRPPTQGHGPQVPRIPSAHSRCSGRPPRRRSQVPRAHTPPSPGAVSSSWEANPTSPRAAQGPATAWHPHLRAQPPVPTGASRPRAQRGWGGRMGRGRGSWGSGARPPGAARAAPPALPRPPGREAEARVSANRVPSVGPDAQPGEEAQAPGAWLPGASLTSGSPAAPPSPRDPGARTSKHTCSLHPRGAHVAR